MKAYIFILSSFMIISCSSRHAGTSHIIYDHATITQLTNKNDLKEQKLYVKAVKRKREELAVYENHSTLKKSKKH